MSTISLVSSRLLLPVTFRACPLLVQKRYLNLHEFQSKQLMSKYGINTQPFYIAHRPIDVQDFAKKLNATQYVVKAQILAGGRGKGTFANGFKGGVHIVNDVNAIFDIADNMLGSNLITKQTPSGGVPVTRVMVAQALNIVEEKYLAILLDRSAGGPVIVASPEGGMDIEEVASSKPDMIFKFPINIEEGMSLVTATEIARCLYFPLQHLDKVATEVQKLYDMFIKVDATQIEINPFGLTDDGQVICFDAKINFDDNAKFRQEQIFELQDYDETDPREVEALRHNLNYVGMDGNIGCLVNGAGLAMATMDIIKLYKGEPANFLDVGGGVKEEQVLAAFKLITKDPQVKAILVNIFGGIVDCRVVANGIVAAYNQIDVKLPVVVRLEGNNGAEAKQILDNSGFNITSANDMSNAAEKVTAFVK